MNSIPVSAAPSLTLRKFHDDYLARYPYKTFPIVDDNRLVGAINRGAIWRFPPAQWDRHTVAECLIRVSEENTVRPEIDAAEALDLMVQTGNPRLLVSQWEKLVGIVSYGSLYQAARERETDRLPTGQKFPAVERTSRG
jgi:CBS-domain-containing membrane protein